MKKKITAIFLCVALVAIAIVGASLAYFTDTKTATNTFTMGDVKITLDETSVANPTGPRVTENTYNTYPGAVVVKDPTVHNTGKNAAWIRATVKVEGWETNRTKYPNYMAGGLEDSLQYLIDGLGAGWSVVGATAANGDVTFVLKYANELAAGADTTPMFQQVKVPAGLENNEVFGKITVTADAIQVDGLGTWDAAFAEFDK